MHSPRSPWKPLRIVEGRQEHRKGRCHPCERYLGVHKVRVDFVYQPETVTVAGHTLQPGWYCPRCLERSKRSD